MEQRKLLVHVEVTPEHRHKVHCFNETRYKYISESDNLAMTDISGVGNDNEMVESDNVSGNIFISHLGENNSRESHANMRDFKDRSRNTNN